MSGTKGPSLSAIRKFKEQQERKKLEEDERRIREKLLTLGHRAEQGDRKAKIELKRYEKAQEDRKNRPHDVSNQTDEPNNKHRNHQHNKQPQSKAQSNQQSKKGTVGELDFEELMDLAKTNNNQIRPKSEPAPAPTKPVPQALPRKQRQQPPTQPANTIPPRRTDHKLQDHKHRDHKSRDVPRPVASNPSQQSLPRQLPPRQLPPGDPHQRHPPKRQIPPPLRRPLLPPRKYESDDDDYESDGFVVNDDDVDVRDELSETLKSVFRYDRRRCDLREEELDRQYRAIGNVSTFEDLEREERRASRMAANEDAKALREEEERKRMKRLRLKR